MESLNTDQTPNHLRREALYKLGLVHLKMKNTDIAKMAFEKVVEQNINDDYNRKAKTKLSKIK